MKKIVIIGAGGFGREVAWLIEDINKNEKQFEIVGFLDDNSEKKNSVVYGYKILGGIEAIKLEDTFFVCAIGNAKIKEKLVKKALEIGLKPINVIHPSVMIGQENELGKGLIICANSIITVNTKLEDYVTINLNCTIGHDTKIEKYTTLYPGVNLSGDCVVGKSCELGTNSTIIQGKIIENNSIIGAAAVVVKNVEENSVIVGNPGRKIVK